MNSTHSSARSYRVSTLTWLEVEQLILKQPLAILPIGAQSKEHGLHLPMDTDYQQAEWLTEQLLAYPDLLIWPTLNCGYYPAFVEFPGSLTISDEAFMSTVKDTCACIFKAGIKKIAILNTGISTIKPLKAIESTSIEQINLVNVYSGERFKKVVDQLIEQTAGGHADEVETSIMLAINPSQVQMDKATGSLMACSQPGILSREDANSSNFTPSGACGSPEKANENKGLALLEAMLEDIFEQLQTFKSQP